MSTDAAEAAPADQRRFDGRADRRARRRRLPVRRRDQAVLRDVSFRIGRGESFGLVGESGCGKSTMALAIVRYLARNGRVSAGSIAIDGQDVLAMNEGALRRLRANTVSMVYQEPGRALNPSIRVGPQVAEVFQIAGKSDKEALELSEEMLRKVRISDPAGVMQRYPHQLSGGMLQRAVIAMALASEPSLLILDEPTTALDATVEAEVLDLVKALRAGVRHLAAVHQPQSRRDRQDVRSRRGAVRRRARRGGAGARGPAQRAPSLHRRSAALHPAPGRRQAPARAGHDPRLSAPAGRDAERLHLRQPLRAGSGPLPHRGAAAVRNRRGAAVALPLPRARADAAADRAGGDRRRRRPGRATASR